MNSHGMQSASLYNYASITCSVCALISHLKSMTRVHRGPSKAAIRDHCPCRFLSPSYLERTSKAPLILHQAPRFEMFGGKGARGPCGPTASTHTHTNRLAKIEQRPYKQRLRCWLTWCPSCEAADRCPAGCWLQVEFCLR